MQDASVLVQAARHAQEEAAIDRQRSKEKEVAADETHRLLQKEKAETTSARAALSAAIKNAHMREEAARLIQARLSSHIRPHVRGDLRGDLDLTSTPYAWSGAAEAWPDTSEFTGNEYSTHEYALGGGGGYINYSKRNTLENGGSGSGRLDDGTFGQQLAQIQQVSYGWKHPLHTLLSPCSFSWYT